MKTDMSSFIIRLAQPNKITVGWLELSTKIKINTFIKRRTEIWHWGEILNQLPTAKSLTENDHFNSFGL